MKQSRANIFVYAFVASIILLLFAGCSANGPIFEKVSVIPEGKGIIYIFQAPNAGPIAITTPIYVYDKPVVVIRDKGYFAYGAYPGKIVMSGSQGKRSTVEIDVKEGKEYYVQCKYSMGMRYGGRAQIHLKVVPASLGETRIAKCRMMNN